MVAFEKKIWGEFVISYVNQDFTTAALIVLVLD